MKKEYYIPVVEITILEAEVVMDSGFPIAGSSSHGQSQAPERRVSGGPGNASVF